MSFLKALLALAIGTQVGHCAFVSRNAVARGPVFGRIFPAMLGAAASSDEDSKTQDLLDKASKLRQEAVELEKTLREENGGVASSQTESQLPPPSYKDARGSIWTLSYLFAAKPAPKNEKPDERSNASASLRFGGKLTVLLKTDGYTELVSHDPSSTETLEVSKVWGWDLERSNEDEKDYILFSMDGKMPDGTKDRFYLQARQDTDPSSGEISLVEGTVTIKQDVSESGSRWGLFSPQGILAEFRYVGDFIARPTRPE